MGGMLIILGAGSLVLPYFGLQFRMLTLVDAYQPFAGIGMLAVGIAITVFSGGANKVSNEGTSQSPSSQGRGRDAA